MPKANVTESHQNHLARPAEVQAGKHIEVWSHGKAIARIVAESATHDLRSRPLRRQPVGVRHAHREGPPRSLAI